MIYHIQVTVNTDSNEYDYRIPREADLNALMQRIKDMHPNMTSVLMYICIHSDGTCNEI